MESLKKNCPGIIQGLLCTAPVGEGKDKDGGGQVDVVQYQVSFIVVVLQETLLQFSPSSGV